MKHELNEFCEEKHCITITRHSKQDITKRSRVVALAWSSALVVEAESLLREISMNGLLIVRVLLVVLHALRWNIT